MIRYRPYNFLFCILALTLISTPNAFSQCSLSVTIPDTIIVEGNTQIVATQTGTNTIKKITWSPALGLSDTSILNPVIAAGTSSKKYYLTIKSLVTTNLANNGSFTSGNTGFTNTYTYMTSGPTYEGQYYVVTNPNSINALWPSMGDHTGSGGKMLIIDAALVANASCWSQTITVKPNTYYNLSAWATLLYLPRAVLQFKINGSMVGNSLTTDSTIGFWKKYEGEWYSGASTTANISLYDSSLVGYGNDFAVDDISLQEICFLFDSVYVKGNSEHIQNSQSTTSLSLFPNPNTGTFTITGSFAHTGNVAFEIINALGQVVYKKYNDAPSKEINEQVDIQNLSNGVYILKMKTPDEHKWIKFSISK